MLENPYADAPAEGACWNCGFLCKLVSPLSAKPTEFADADWGDRHSGFGQTTEPNENATPWCYQGVTPGPFEELAEVFAAKGSVEPSDALEVYKRERKCSSWLKHHPGRTLNQNYDEWRMLSIEKLRREQAQMIADVEQRGQEALRLIMADHKTVTEKLAGITSDQSAASDRQEKSNRRFNWLFLGLGSIAVLLALTPLAYPNGIEWVFDHAPGAVSIQPEQEAERGTSPATAAQPSPAAAESTPTPSPESTPGTPSSTTPAVPGPAFSPARR